MHEPLDPPATATVQTMRATVCHGEGARVIVPALQ